MDNRMGDNINGPTLIRMPDWAPGFGKYHLYFSIKNVNEEMYKNAMKHMAEMQNDFLDNATS